MDISLVEVCLFPIKHLKLLQEGNGGEGWGKLLVMYDLRASWNWIDIKVYYVFIKTNHWLGYQFPVLFLNLNRLYVNMKGSTNQWVDMTDYLTEGSIRKVF